MRNVYTLSWALVSLFVFLAGSAQAASIVLDNCGAQGCTSTTVSLTSSGNGALNSALAISSDSYTGAPLTLNQINVGTLHPFVSLVDTLKTRIISVGPAIPEPSAAFIFGLGTLLVTRRARS
jgi:hypothetical protein